MTVSVTTIWASSNRCNKELAVPSVRFWCGVGRLSRALSTSFQRVFGVDISDAMLSEARSANPGFDNIEFLRNSGDSLASFADGTVDFIYSAIALQHSPRKNQRSLIKEFCRILRPGGTLIFQTPSRQNVRTVKGILYFLLGNRILNIATRIRHGTKRIMEMHSIRKDEVVKLLREGGMELLDAEIDDRAGTAFISYTYFAIKS